MTIVENHLSQHLAGMDYVAVFSQGTFSRAAKFSIIARTGVIPSETFQGYIISLTFHSLALNISHAHSSLPF
jgi:hypothetical protein